MMKDKDIEELIKKERAGIEKAFEELTMESNLTPYDTLGDYVEKWLKEVNGCYEDVIVGIKMKYDHETEYERLNVIFSPYGDGNGIWEYDWWEGQQEVYLVGIIPISEVDTFMQDTTTVDRNFYDV